MVPTPRAATLLYRLETDGKDWLTPIGEHRAMVIAIRDRRPPGIAVPDRKGWNRQNTFQVHRKVGVFPCPD